PLPEAWADVSHKGSGTIMIDTTDSVSAPGSLLFATPALGSSDTAQAVVSRGGLARGVAHIELDVKIEKVAFPNVKDVQASESLVAITQGKTYSLLFTLRASETAPFALSIVEIVAPVGQTAVTNL